MAQMLLGQPKIKLGFAAAKERGCSGLEWIEVGAGSRVLKIPVDQDVATLIPYRGRQGSFRHISVAEVYPGVEIHANMSDAARVANPFCRTRMAADQDRCGAQHRARQCRQHGGRKFVSLIL